MVTREKVPNLTINDFPTEIIEMFSPDLSVKTLNVMRLVSKRFNSVFNQDKFLKCHLLYSEKQYLSDLLSNSISPGVKDVLEDIALGRYGKAHGYYKLQNAHFENWLTGQSQNIDTIDLLPSTVLNMKEKVDDNNERWLYFSVGKNICIWNITAKPYPLNPVNVGLHSNLNILPEGRILIQDNSFDTNDGLIAIYKQEELSLKLEHNFIYYMDSTINEPHLSIPRPSFEFCFVVIKNVFIGYNPSITSYRGELLHCWSLDSCVKMATISLSELDCNSIFKKYFAYDTRYKTSICRVDVYPAPYPDVLISLRYLRVNMSMVIIFNLELMRVTHLIETLMSNIVTCSKNCNIVSIVADSHVINYEVHPITPDVDLIYGDMLTFIQCENKNRNNILLTNSKMLLKYTNKVAVVSLATNSLKTQTVEVAENFIILGYIEPVFLLLYDSSKTNKGGIKVYYVPNGKEIMHLKNLNIGYNNIDYYRNLEYISKLVINCYEGTLFKVLNF